MNNEQAIALITLSAEGVSIIDTIADGLSGARLYAHRNAEAPESYQVFDSVLELTSEIFTEFDGICYVLPCGVAVRAIAPHIQSKLSDPAVVVVDVGGRWAVSLLSGHEGGANDLAYDIGNLINAEPIISTTTEARKNVIAGIGCRRGVSCDDILSGLHRAMSHSAVTTDDIRMLASADIKSDETGLLEAAASLDRPIQFISSEEIRSTCKSFEHSDFVQSKVGLPAVSEPAALLAGRRTTLILPKTTYGPVTVALARENCLWSA